MDLNGRRSVLGVNSPYRVVFPIPDGKTLSNPTEGSDFRQVGYSYRKFNRYQVGGGGTTYIDSATILHVFRNSQNVSININSTSDSQTNFRTSNLIGISSNNSSNIFAQFNQQNSIALLIGAIASITEELRTGNSFQLAMASLAGIFHEFRGDAAGGIASLNSTNIFHNFSTDNTISVLFSSIINLYEEWRTLNGGGLAYSNSSNMSTEFKNSSSAGILSANTSEIRSNFIISSDAAIFINALTNIFYDMRTSNGGGIASSNGTNLFSEFRKNAEGGISYTNNLNIFANFLQTDAGQLLMSSATELIGQFGISPAAFIAMQSQAGLIGLFSVNPESEIRGSLLAECNSAINFMSSAIAGISMAAPANILTNMVLGNAGGISTDNNSSITSIHRILDNPQISISSSLDARKIWQNSSDNILSMNNQGNIRTNFISDCVPAVLGAIEGFCNAALQSRLASEERLLIGGILDIIGKTGNSNEVKLDMGGVTSILSRFGDEPNPSLTIGGGSSMRSEFRADNNPGIMSSNILNILGELRNAAVGGLNYSDGAEAGISFQTPTLPSVFLNSILSASMAFGSSVGGGLNLASEVYFINRLATENNIRASIIGAIDITGRVHIFMEEPEVNGLGQFYVADFILRRKSLEELNLYRLALSHNNLNIQQTSLKDLNIDQIRSYIVSIKEAGLFEVNRRI